MRPTTFPVPWPDPDRRAVSLGVSPTQVPLPRGPLRAGLASGSSSPGPPHPRGRSPASLRPGLPQGKESRGSLFQHFAC